MSSRKFANSIIARVVTALAIPLVVAGVALFGVSPAVLAATFALVLAVALIWPFSAHYANPAVAFFTPWVLVLVFSGLPLSAYARPVTASTHFLMLVTLLVALVVFLVSTADVRGPVVREPRGSLLGTSIRTARIGALFIVFMLMSFANIGIAGYVPLIEAVQNAETSGYLDFGVKGFYGLYNAFANALAVTCFYVWLVTGKRTYLLLFVTILGTFLLFLSRQNMLLSLVEAMLVYTFVRGPISRRTVAIAVLTVLLGFAALGALRTGSIREIALIYKEYDWLPDIAVWLYAYSYFNVLNLDNLVQSGMAPYFDGSSLYQLIPSFLRPELDETNLREVTQFTVSSYMYPIYRDIGLTGLILFTTVVLYLTARAYRRAAHYPSYISTTTYAALYYCALFSFFVNNWFYLPVIFQLAFFWLFGMFVFRRARDSFVPVASTT